MTAGASFAAAVAASLDRLGEGWRVATPGADPDDGPGIPLDDAATLLLFGPDVDSVPAAGEAAVLAEALAAARAAVGAAVAAAAVPGEAERALPTMLGGPAVWERACAEAVTASAGLPDEHAVVVVRTDDAPDRAVERTAAALRRAVRGHDAVCRLEPGRYAVLALCWPRGPVTLLVDRLVGALLDIGVGAAAGAVVDKDPRRALPGATARADRAWAERKVMRL
ncbi:MAG TPA: hypothetical protein VF288_06455 [Mycobacteriales bacterium]